MSNTYKEEFEKRFKLPMVLDNDKLMKATGQEYFKLWTFLINNYDVDPVLVKKENDELVDREEAVAEVERFAEILLEKEDFKNTMRHYIIPTLLQLLGFKYDYPPNSVYQYLRDTVIPCLMKHNEWEIKDYVKKPIYREWDEI